MHILIQRDAHTNAREKKWNGWRKRGQVDKTERESETLLTTARKTTAHTELTGAVLPKTELNKRKNTAAAVPPKHNVQPWIMRGSFLPTVDALSCRRFHSVCMCFVSPERARLYVLTKSSCATQVCVNKQKLSGSHLASRAVRCVVECLCFGYATEHNIQPHQL